MADDPQPVPSLPGQVVLTDHVVIRGTYSALQISFMGFVEHDGAEAAASRAEQAVDEFGEPLPPVMHGIPMPDLSFSRLADGAAGPGVFGPAVGCTLPGGPLLPLPSLPPNYSRGVQMASAYFLEVSVCLVACMFA